jgi:DNA-binding XRE family transcriptional regulator
VLEELEQLAARQNHREIVSRAPGPTIPLTAENRTRLKVARNLTGLSQRRFGQQLGITKYYVSAVECGRSDPSKQLLSRWCNAIGLKVTFDGSVTISRKDEA